MSYREALCPRCGSKYHSDPWWEQIVNCLDCGYPYIEAKKYNNGRYDYDKVAVDFIKRGYILHDENEYQRRRSLL